MITLAINSATRSAAVALLDDGVPLLEILINLDRHHGETLLPAVDTLYRTADRSPAETGLIALTTGPGSFTGLRIGASVVKGLAMAWGVPVVGVSTLAALALNGGPGERLVCPMLDARKEEVYAALFRLEDGGEVLEIEPGRVTPLEGFLRKLKGEILFIGDGAVRYESRIRSFFGGKAVFPAPSGHLVRASSVGLLGLKKFHGNDILNILTFVPHYLRLSEAEKRKAVESAEGSSHEQ